MGNNSPKNKHVILIHMAVFCVFLCFSDAKATDSPKNGEKGNDIPCEIENYSFEDSYAVTDNKIKKQLAVFRGSGGAHNSSFIVALATKKSCNILINDDGLDITFVPSKTGKYPDISINRYGDEGSYYRWNGKKYILRR
jgi:hypothetical protein